ncbi:hypothetical protein DFA_08887 [Cavenderia fasciculata]|uniref:Uncharacterized protein n=1 Tax=Cavenderia fasciculata TaxID=261658 RepID=F4Q4U0_CACFS|nr:uncharacterized protein DFA_08887 [Cavenderia fasciculata]EGG17886.1 hypothetical protein DFA_08887 [Cavenderia fasciculata]|eukprot:XP_004356370.1 hypothetical protein DFA_08887 [Cavenderia fasciculata]
MIAAVYSRHENLRAHSSLLAVPKSRGKPNKQIILHQFSRQPFFKMNKLYFQINLIILLFIFFLSNNCIVQSYEISKIEQNEKTLYIHFSPQHMIWFKSELEFNGSKLDIKPYCSQNGISPMVCHLDFVPECDTVRLFGTPGIGSTNLKFMRSFNCTSTFLNKY